MLCVPSARHLFGTASLASSALSASAELLVCLCITWHSGKISLLLFLVNLDHVITNVSRSFFGYAKYDSMSGILMKFSLPMADTVFYNAGILFRLHSSCS